MKKQRGKLLELIRGKNSANGNPRYTAIILNGAGYVDTVETGVDSSFAYGISNYLGKLIVYRTKESRGKIVFADIDTIEAPYVASELARIEGQKIGGEFAPKILVSCGGEKTKYINVSWQALEQIKDILVLDSFGKEA